MAELDVSTVVHTPREDVYEYLLDFPRYASYSQYIDDIEATGDGRVGTEYAISVGWWSIHYTVDSRVTGLDPPERIGFAVEDVMDAEGEWRVVEVDAGTSRVHFVVRYRPETVSSDGVDLPSLVPVDAVLDRAETVARSEAERIVERVIEDLEGERRDVELTVEH